MNEVRKEIPLSVVNEAIEIIHTLRDNTLELLADHDARFGRTTKKNRLIANALESELQQALTVMVMLER